MPHRPLIVRLRNWVGDVVLGLPLLERLEQAGYELHLVGKGWARDLLAGHGWPVEPLGRGLRDRVAQLRRLGREGLSRAPGFAQGVQALVLPYSLSSALEARLAGLRPMGYRHEARGLLLHQALPRNMALHEMAAYWELGSALLGHGAPLPARVHLRIAGHHQERARALRRALGLHDGFLVVCPFAGGTFEKLDKCWPGFPRWVEQRLPPLGRQVLICPAPGEEEAVAARDYGGCIVARGVDLGTYAALLQDAALVVSNDTGPGHMAAAVGAPLLSVLGPTDPARWGAVGPSVHIVQGAAGAWPAEDEVHARAVGRLAAG